MSVVAEPRRLAPRPVAVPSPKKPAGEPVVDVATRGNLRAMMADGAAFSVMVGLGENYLPAFALALGMGEVVAGLIASVPLLIGAVLQLVTPWAVARLGSNRRWVILCATVQGLSFLPLVLAALAGRLATPAIFLIAAVYWGAGMAAGPAWNSWAATLVPSRIRAGYFARRTRLTQGGTLLGFLCGGIALQTGSAAGHVLWAFAAIFGTAAMCRLISARFLARHSEPVLPRQFAPTAADDAAYDAGSRQAVSRLLYYLVAVQAAAQIAGPYFAPYMLGRLKFSYTTYVTIIAASLVAKTIALPWIGKLAQRYGARRLLYIGGVATVPLPALWLISESPWFLIGVQLAAGFSWAIYELAMFLLFFEALPPAQRTRLLTRYNLAHATATVVGSLLGGLVLSGFGETRSAYLVVFALSSVARIATIPLLQKLPRGERHAVVLATRSLAVRPSAGTVDQPVLASLEDAESDGRAAA